MGSGRRKVELAIPIDSSDDAFEHLPYVGLVGRGLGQVLKPPKKLIDLNEVRSQRLLGKFPIAFAAGGALRKDEIVSLQAKGDGAFYLADPAGISTLTRRPSQPAGPTTVSGATAWA